MSCALESSRYILSKKPVQYTHLPGVLRHCIHTRTNWGFLTPSASVDRVESTLFWNSRGFDVLLWLILPVVICLSQSLSHASLSTNCFKVKPQKAQ
ncbi:hypothetical protein GE061_020192 [Apolygus lucorum]|uniref:Uncharacterized protein n=1 Tax=Apolygus lucorum TaxID=248454 RepID=A0A8S9WK14_APOLU|nr:hypothetical protein GE061_020192 [Apolygus lucorum]